MLKRVQLMLDDDLEARLAVEAKLEGISKSELVRRILRERLPARRHKPAIWEMVGAAGDAEPAKVDDVVYGPLEAE